MPSYFSQPTFTLAFNHVGRVVFTLIVILHITYYLLLTFRLQMQHALTHATHANTNHITSIRHFSSYMNMLISCWPNGWRMLRPSYQYVKYVFAKHNVQITEAMEYTLSQQYGCYVPEELIT